MADGAVESVTNPPWPLVAWLFHGRSAITELASRLGMLPGVGGGCCPPGDVDTGGGCCPLWSSDISWA